MAPLFDYLSTEQVAQMMGVTPARVRQLAGAGSLPRSRSLPGLRGALYSRSAIQAYLDGRRSAVADDLPPAEAPAELVTEQLWSYRDRTLPATIHVRHYRSHDREVVVLADAGKYQMLTTWIEQIVTELLDQQVVRSEDPANIVWVQLAPSTSYSSSLHTRATSIDNVVLRPERREDGKIAWTSPGWSNLTWDELRDLLGHQIDVYLWEHYSPEAVTAWLRRKPRPLEVFDDEYNVAGYLQTLRVLRERHDLSTPVREIVTAGLAQSVSMRISSYKHMPVRPPAKGDPSATTMTLLPLVLSQEVQEMVEQLQPADDLAFDVVDAAVVPLREFAERFDKTSVTPDPELHAHIERAQTALGELRTTTHPEHTPPAVREPHADVTTDIVGPWDKLYLSGCTWNEGLLNSRERTILGSQWVKWPEYRCAFGKGPDGTAVMLIEPVDGKSKMMVRWLWPTAPLAAEDLSPDLELVADGDAGDRPVYLVRGGSIVALLPRPETIGQWNFGYGGGGPGALAGAVRRLFADAGIDLDDYHYERIRLEVEQSSQDALHIPLSAVDPRCP